MKKLRAGAEVGEGNSLPSSVQRALSMAEARTVGSIPATGAFPILDETTHKYWLGDVEIPSVSSILQAAGLTDLKFVNQYALDRGTAIHNAIHYHHEGTLDDNSIDPVVKPYLEQFKKFLAISGAKILSAEQIVYDSFRNYAGKYDLLVKMNGAVWLLDAKTNTKPKHVGTQLGAYYCAARSNGIAVQKLGCLVLKPERFMFTEFLALPSQADWFRALTKARAC